MFSPVVFEGSEATNMTAHFGSTAMLACRIRNNVEDNPVSEQVWGKFTSSVWLFGISAHMVM